MKAQFKIVAYVDIYQLPDAASFSEMQILPNQEISIGDLHGNAMKLLFTLLAHGFASGINAEDYQKLVEIYKKDVNTLTADDLSQFTLHVNKLSFVKHGRLNLIGDDFCDRGQNDKFTLIVFIAMHVGGLNFTVEYSNHTREFIRLIELNSCFVRGGFSYDRHIISMLNLQTLIDRKLVNREEMVSSFNDCYLPHMLLIKYSVSSENERTLVTLFMHAPNLVSQVAEVAALFKVLYLDVSVEDLCNTIDAINQAFKANLAAKTLHTCDDTKRTLHEFVWNRNEGDIYEEVRTATPRNYDIHYVHGHDNKLSNTRISTNLDKVNAIGHPTPNTGAYSFYIETLPPPKLASKRDRFFDEEGDGHTHAHKIARFIDLT